MNVYQCVVNNDLNNYCYVLESTAGDQFLIDPIDCPHLREHIGDGSKLKAIICTHGHHDHISLNEKFKSDYNVEVYGHEGVPGVTKTVADGDEITIDDENVLKVLYTPGHTACDICLLHLQKGEQLALFSGDTLFNAGVGNCYSGDPSKLYESVYSKIVSIDDNVTLFPGHDYMCHNLGFTLSVDPENSYAKSFMDKGPLTTIGDEKKINLFFQCDDQRVQRILGKTDAKSSFIELRSRRNNW